MRYNTSKLRGASRHITKLFELLMNPCKICARYETIHTM